MTDVAIYQPGELAAVPPPSGPLDSWIAVADQVVRLAQTIASSPFVPDGLRGSVPATAAAILAGRELGIPPMTALANVHVIKGKTGISALLMRALIQAQGHDWQDGHVSDVSATVRGRRRGESEWAEVTFTAAQAKTAGIPLSGYPQDKLYARATARLARRKFADVIAGMPYSAEDLEDGVPEGAVLAGESYHDERKAEAVPAPRTTRRRQSPGPAPAGHPAGHEPAAGPGPTPAPDAGATAPTNGHAASQAAPAADLPPLPGEDEAIPEVTVEFDKDEPGTVTLSEGMIGKIQTVYSAQMGFKRAERDHMIAATEQIIGRELTGPSPARTHNNLSWNEAMTLIDTLERCGDRERLIELLAAAEPREAREIRDDGESSE